MSGERFLVTGALGCIGSWVIRQLINEPVSLFIGDLSTDPIRPRLLLGDEELQRATFFALDITDLDALVNQVERRRITHIIHLAALQVPFCKADPSRGAAVNVVGTVNLFESVRRVSGQVKGLSYASSVAVLGPPEIYPEGLVSDNVQLRPRTLYGTFKVANETCAQIYWDDWRVASVGLRPYIVYGVARDQGLTSDFTRAILAAVAGRPFRIKFGGRVAIQYAPDVASMFVQAARTRNQGAAACNLRGDVIDVEDFTAMIREVIPTAAITFDSDTTLPFPSNLDDSGLRSIVDNVQHTPVPGAIRQTAGIFDRLLKAGRIDLSQLED